MSSADESPKAADPVTVEPATEIPTPPTPEERISALETEKGELRDRMLRIAADFENWKKRSRREAAETETKGREGVLRDVLEVIDNLERALAASNGGVDGASVVKGVELVLRLFNAKLERYGVQPIESKGQPFDPRVHEAISRITTADFPAGTVAMEMQKGYRIGERLLRPAMVGVAAAPPAPAPVADNGESSADEAPTAPPASTDEVPT